MARRGWLGITPLARQGQGHGQALVLSGGGSKASFQIGALRYLYDEAGLHPQTIVGTSAGAILTAMLAQSADRDGQRAALAELERLWLGMTRQSDMFTERSWFRRFRSRAPEVMALLTRDALRGRAGRRLPRINLPFTQGSQLDPDAAQQDEVEPAEEEHEELTPEERTLALATRDPATSGPELTATQVMGVLAGLGRLRGVGADVGVILAGAEKTRSLYIPGPILRELLGSGLFTAARVAASGVTTRIAMVELESGELHFMREDGVLVDREDLPLGPERHEFSQGVLASCSIPVVFRPVAMGRGHYVDGGVRENVPAEMAMGTLGCSNTWVVTSNSPRATLQESFADKDMFSIMMRANEIQSDETERDEIAYARSAGAVVVEPEFDVHDSLTIDPGLVRIAMDYGWMRAAEVHLGATRAEVALGRSIIKARRRIWELERDLLDPEVPHDERELLLLARLKYDLREQVPRLRTGIAPAGAEGWWQQWEAHAVTPQVAPPWIV